MAVGCYHADRVTGVFSLDSGPLDHRYYEAFREMKDVVKFDHELKLNRGRNEIELEIKEKILVIEKKNSGGVKKVFSAQNGEKS